MGRSYKPKKTTEVGDFEGFFPPHMSNGSGFVWKAFTQAENVFASTFKKFFKSVTSQPQSWLHDSDFACAVWSRCCHLLLTQAVEEMKTKRLHLPWQSGVLSGGMSLCISRLDKTPERWHLCLLTDGFLVWHLTGGRSASISQSIVHLIHYSVALMKMQGNILVGFFLNYLFEGVFPWFWVFWGCHLEFRVSGAVKYHNCWNISLGYCSWPKQIMGLKHILPWKFWGKNLHL